MEKTVVELTQMIECLQTVFIPVKETGLNLEANINLARLKKLHTEINEAWKKTSLEHNKKDKDGNQLRFKIQYINLEKGIFEFVRDASGALVEAVDGDEWAHFVEKTKAYMEEYDNYIKSKHTLEIKPFNEEKLKKAFTAGKFDGLDLSPLIGNLIPDTLEI